MEGYRKGLYPDFMMREEMKRVEHEGAAAQRHAYELQQQLARLDHVLSYQGQVEQLARKLTPGLDCMSFTERRELLVLLVDEIICRDDGQVTIRTVIPLEQLPPVTRESERGW